MSQIETAIHIPTTNDDDSNLPSVIITSSTSCLEFLVYLSITIIIIPLILVPIIYINLPEKTLEFHIASLSVSPFLIYPSSLTAVWNITLLATNPYNDKTIYYDAVQVSVYYHSLFLTSSQISMDGSFRQGPKSSAAMQTSLALSSVHIGDLMEEETAMLEEWRSRVVVGFGVGVEGIVRVGHNDKDLKRKLVRANCDYLMIEISSDQTSGVLLGGSRNCDVKEVTS